MEQAPWAPYGNRDRLDLRLQRRSTSTSVIFNPTFGQRPDQLPVQVGRRRLPDRQRGRRAQRRARALRARSLAPGLPAAAAQPRRARLRSASSSLIVVFVLAAPLWADHVAHTGPEHDPHAGKVTVDGEKRDVVSLEGKPIGPLWFGAGGKFFLGADGRLGRDEMVRLMYGGRTSLLDRHRLGADHDAPGDRPRPARRLLPRLDRRRDLADARRDLVLPGASCSGSRSALALAVGGLQDRPDRNLRRLDLDPDPDHRRRLHAVHGAADPRRGAGAARERVRRGRGRPGRRARCG